MTESRDRPSAHGAILGEALSDLAKAGRVGIADFPEMCATCAFREGAMSNQMASTGKVALDCVLGIDADDFGCHHGMEDGKPTKLCAGFMAAKNAPFRVVLAAVQTVHTRLAALTETDEIRAAFDAWHAEVNPADKLDVYQLGRAYEKARKDGRI